MQIRKYDYDKTEITAVCVTDNYLWIAFKESGGSCLLYKTSIFNPNQIYYELSVPVDNINEIKQRGTYIYLAVNDTTYSGIRYKIASPLTSYDYFLKPGGITENSIDLTIDSSYLYLLIPGEISGTNAKILKYNKTTQVLDKTIDLQKSAEEVISARTLDIDSNGDIWVATYTNPMKLIKVYEISGGEYDFDSWVVA